MSAKPKDCGFHAADNINRQDNIIKSNETISIKEIDDFFPISDQLKKDFHNKVAKPLKKMFGNTSVPVRDFDGKIKAIFPNDWEKISMIMKIRSMTEGHRIWRNSLIENFNYELAKVEGLENVVAERPDGSLFIQLDKATMPELRKLYEMTFVNANATEQDIFGGVMGNMRISLETPRSMRWQDVYTSLHQIVTNTNLKLRKFGGAEANKIKIVSYFQRIKSGWMFVENGKVMINSHYGRIKKGMSARDGKPYVEVKGETYVDRDGFFRYHSTNDYVRDYSTPMTIEDYIDGVGLSKEDKSLLKAGKRGYRPEVDYRINIKEDYLKLDRNMISKINKQVERARNLHDDVYDDLNARTKGLENEVLAELKLRFPKKSEKELQDIFSKNKKFTKKWSNKERAEAIRIKKDFVSRIQEGIFTPDGVDNNTDALGYKIDSFPTLYWDSQFVIMLENQIKKLENNLLNYNKELEGTTNKNIIKQIKDDISKTTVALNWAKESLDNHYDADTEVLSGGKVVDRTSAKHFKHISGFFDLRNMRTDSHVYNDYLRKTYGALERSRLTLRAMQADRIAGDNKLTAAYTRAIYDRTMHDPNARANVFGLNMSLHNFYEGVINKLPFKISEKSVEKMLNIVNQYLTGRFLGGFSTAALNKTAVVQKVMEVGMRRWRSSLKSYEENEETWESIMKQSGILEFGDFFAQSLVQDTSEHLELAEDQAFKVIRLQIQYQKDLSDGMSKKAALKKFRDQSEIYVNTFPELRDLKKRQKKEWLNKTQRMVGKWANFAITKQWFARKQSSTALGQILQKASTVQEFYSEQVTKIFPTMQSTEKELRTNSFVIGVERAIEIGILPIDFLDKTKKLNDGKLDGKERDKAIEDMKLAIQWGRDYTRRMDFELSSQGVGEIGQAAGGFLTKFKYWSMQKKGYDVRVFRDAYFSLKDVSKAGKFDKSAVAKTFIQLMRSMSLSKKQAEKVWLDNPEIGKLRNFVLSQGMMTIVLDLMVFGPFFGHILRKMPIVRNFGITKIMSGMTSDLVTLTTTLPIWLAASIAFDDDEEEIQEGLKQKLRHIPFVGFGTTWTLDTIYWLFSMIADEDEKEQFKKGKRALRPIDPLDSFVPGGVLGVKDYFTE